MEKKLFGVYECNPPVNGCSWFVQLLDCDEDYGEYFKTKKEADEFAELSKNLIAELEKAWGFLR